MVHDFNASLQRSHAYASAPWWTDVYKEAFPSMIAAHDMRDDGWHQRAGIDRVVVLSNSKTIAIDEKVREKDYGDILLEFYSDRDRGVPGWVAKDLACDFIAYAVAPTRRCYLLPFLPLRRVWRSNCRDWVNQYGRRDAQNKGYVTVSCPVPVDVLLGSIKDSMVVGWDG